MYRFLLGLVKVSLQNDGVCRIKRAMVTIMLFLLLVSSFAGKRYFLITHQAFLPVLCLLFGVSEYDRILFTVLYFASSLFISLNGV